MRLKRIAKAEWIAILVIDRVYSGAPCLVRLFLDRITYLKRMGRSYWFECVKCGYRAVVAGRADRGLSLVIQTILCRDCKQLYDAVTRLRVSEESSALWPARLQKTRSPKSRPHKTAPPAFQAALNRLPPTAAGRSRWLPFKIQCPVSAFHRVREWNAPDRCPRCGVLLEKGALPYRLWD